ncbi:D-alanyl-D-alanine carboxypeptidase/D-alanyl-D-alanine-endopeptidase [Maribacter algicola]|uniref:D-alanyl-D-alanine carboxypeptidase/D-alanyl-D-alanine-endopeptidase n=1 Tax=Meishania litoralis TaxID=3434685 RepID=A0ACC7LMC2_9FLAO
MHKTDHFFGKSTWANRASKVLVLLFLIGCGTTKNRIQKHVATTIDSPFFKNQFTGLLVIDPITKDTLIDRNGARYFTPASNTKIFTLYAALQLLPDQIPALKSILKNDTLFIEGTGDPTLLHPHFNDSTTIEFLKGYKNIALYLNNFHEQKYGPGWSWDDYPYYYQPERAAFPLYGNVATIFGGDSTQVLPEHFKKNVVDLDLPKNREAEKNIFYYAASRRDTTEIPYRIDSTLTRILLEKALNKKVTVVNKIPKGEKSIVYGMSTDSVLKRMMHQSDNFLAEQLMLLSTSTLTDTLNFAKARDHILENQLVDLRHPPRWVDGSGLSRYNLFTPQSMVHVLQKLYGEIPRERLFHFFPAGGVSGTLEDWYPGNHEPYIFAKTGSLGNNHCLSGYLITKSGKTLIFSFMNNHFRNPSSEVKKRMQAILETIRDSY